MARDEALIYLVVDEWDTSTDDLESEESAAIAEDAGAVPGRAFGFAAGDVAAIIGVEPDDDVITLAVRGALDGGDDRGLLDGMLDRASDATGWCVLSSHVEQE